MTIDEAIKHCLEVAENNDLFASGKWIGSEGEANRQECEQCAADHRQLAEWLTELKEAKRLLKAAVEDLERLGGAEICFSGCDERCPFDCVGGLEEKHWKYLDEALKLIKED